MPVRHWRHAPPARANSARASQIGGAVRRERTSGAVTPELIQEIGFLQSIMLVARSHGLHTCAQAAIAEYPRIVRRHLPIPDNHSVVCGIALGYADFSARVNQFRTTRCTVDEFATFAGF